MDTESYEQYSRKRPHETNEGYTNITDSSYKRPTNPSSSSSGKPTLKYLLPNFMAGKLIGKGGTNIAELQSKFRAFIRVSPNGEYYPGTGLRIIAVSAEVEDIKEFTNHLIQMVDEEERSDRHNPELKPEVQFVVSNIAAGLVLGKGGASIKAIQSSSDGAKISLSRKEESVSGERLICVSGSVASRSSACKQIVDVMSAEPEKMSNSNMSYFGTGGGAAPSNNMRNHHAPPPPQQQHQQQQQQQQHQPRGVTAGFNPQASSDYNSLASIANVINNAMSSLVNQQQQQQQQSNQGNNGTAANYVPKSGAKPKFSCEIEMPEKCAGTIIGKGGQTIHEVTRKSGGARLQFSSKDDYAAGVHQQNRVLTITGDMSQVRSAYMLVDEKLAQVEPEFDYPFRQSYHVNN